MNSDRELIFERLKTEVVPLFIEVLRKGNPSEFARWQGNACRQAAVFSYIYCLINVDDITSAAIYEGMFSGSVCGRQMTFDHSWLCIEIGDEMYVIDYSGATHGMRVIKSQGNKVYWGGSAIYKDIVEESRKQSDPHAVMGGDEFYTGRKIGAIYQEIMEEACEA